jgi:hypothetical protein
MVAINPSTPPTTAQRHPLTIFGSFLEMIAVFSKGEFPATAVARRLVIKFSEGLFVSSLKYRAQKPPRSPQLARTLRLWRQRGSVHAGNKIAA